MSLQKNPNPGDLIYLPAGTKLVQTDDRGDTVQDWTFTKSPVSLLMTEHDSCYCSVVYQGRKWKALAGDCYNHEEETS